MFDDLLGQYVYSFTELPDDGKYHYAQRMYVRRFSEEGRKQVNVNICDDERIEVYVPMRSKPFDMRHFMDENGFDILLEKNRRLDEESKAYSEAEPLTYESKLPFLGEYLPIRVIPDNDSRIVYLQDNAIYIKDGLDDTRIRSALLMLCRNKAYEYLKPKVDHYAGIMGVEYSRLEIDDGRRTWGLFHEIYKHITLSRRLLLMNESIIDFLIVHELAHSLTLRHDEEHDFEMGKILPDYEERDVAFNEACGLLIKQGWA